MNTLNQQNIQSLSLALFGRPHSLEFAGEIARDAGMTESQAQNLLADLFCRLVADSRLEHASVVRAQMIEPYSFLSVDKAIAEVRGHIDGQQKVLKFLFGEKPTKIPFEEKKVTSQGVLVDYFCDLAANEETESAEKILKQLTEFHGSFALKKAIEDTRAHIAVQNSILRELFHMQRGDGEDSESDDDIPSQETVPAFVPSCFEAKEDDSECPSTPKKPIVNENARCWAPKRIVTRKQPAPVEKTSELGGGEPFTPHPDENFGKSGFHLLYCD
jgi:hypothetical protein